MLLDTVVDIPKCQGHIVFQKKFLSTYVLFTVSRKYNSKTKKSAPKRVTIGKVCPDNPSKMIPNERFAEFFPDIDLNLNQTNLESNNKADSTPAACANDILPQSSSPSAQPSASELLSAPKRADSISIGPYSVIQSISNDDGLMDCLVSTLGEAKAKLTMDIASYLVITEGNQAQHYPAYAWDHALFTPDMRIYSDSTISRHLRKISHTDIMAFFKAWNEGRARDKKVNISYDSTNKNCQAGDLDFAEFGHAKVDIGTRIINSAIGYDTDNQVPLFYEAYPGSIPDVSQLSFAIKITNDLGYNFIRFILDRGFFSKENIKQMDDNGFDFVLMVKGYKSIVAPMIKSKLGTFEKMLSNRIYGDLFGITIQSEFCGRQRYFHIYHSLSSCGYDAQSLLDNIDSMESALTKLVGHKFTPNKGYEQFFNFNISKTKGDLLSFSRNEQAIEERLNLCGYFSIVTSEEMSAQEAHTLYKSRDGSEKLFCFEKTFLGGNSYRIHSNAALQGKMFIEFIALILRSRIYTLLKQELVRYGKSCKHLNVPAAIRELDKIRITLSPNGKYRLMYSLTKAQKQILASFGISIDSLIQVAKEASNILSGLPVYNEEEPDALEMQLEEECRCDDEVVFSSVTEDIHDDWVNSIE